MIPCSDAGGLCERALRRCSRGSQRALASLCVIARLGPGVAMSQTASTVKRPVPRKIVMVDTWHVQNGRLVVSLMQQGSLRQCLSGSEYGGALVMDDPEFCNKFWVSPWWAVHRRMKRFGDGPRVADDCKMHETSDGPHCLKKEGDEALVGRQGPPAQGGNHPSIPLSSMPLSVGAPPPRVGSCARMRAISACNMLVR